MQQPDNETLTITREFNAPRELVFKAWTESDRLVKWWGPKGLTMKTAQMDLKPGGTFLYGMTTPDGAEMWGKFVFREIEEPQKLVFVVSFCDSEGNIQRHPMSDSWPLEVINTILFEEKDGKTLLTLHGQPINATPAETDTFIAARDGVRQGFAGTMGQLDDYLASL